MSIQKMRRIRRTYSPEFKQQIVEIYNQGKSRQEILREYELTPSAFDKWVQQFNKTGSLNAKDYESARDKAMEELKQQNKELAKQLKEQAKLLEEKEVTIYVLKQAAAILAQK